MKEDQANIPYEYFLGGIDMIADDTINDVTVTNGGSGYTSVPTATIPAPVGGGTTAEAYVTIDTSLTGITITDQGGGYITTPTVSIDGPGFSGTVWNVNHNLNQKHVNFEIIKTVSGDDVAIDHIYNMPNIEFVDANNLRVTWQNPTNGFIDVIKSKFVSALQATNNEWVIDHNLGEQFPNIEVIYTDGVYDLSAQGTFDHPFIEYTSNTQCKIKFPADVQKTGYIVATHNLGNNGATGTGYNHTNASSATWTITHGLGKKHVNVDLAVSKADVISNVLYEGVIEIE